MKAIASLLDILEVDIARIRHLVIEDLNPMRISRV
jgi:hypothetical protein